MQVHVLEVDNDDVVNAEADAALELRPTMIDSTDMCNKQVTIDLTYAKNALFVRQSVAVAFAVPIDREITWIFLQDLLCNSSEFAVPARVLVCGLPSASGTIGDEIRMFRTFLRALATTRSIEVQIVLHD